jgi:hypothetical protein
MKWSIDARVPVVFGRLDEAGADDAVLIEGDAPAPGVAAVLRFMPGTDSGHVAGCACCVPRGTLATLLGSSFLLRARGEVAFYRRVVAVVADEAPLRAVLADDPLVSSRFRLA